MTISGAQANQTTGGPQPWEPGSVQDRGIDDIRKLGVGVTPDSLLKPISDMNRQQVWKYEAGAAHPELGSPRQLRGADELGQGSTPTWGNPYDQLIEALPPDVKAELLNQKDQLFTNRDPGYAGFDVALQFAAQSMNQASGVNAPLPSNSAAEVRQNLNYAVPGIALNSVLDSSLEVIQNVAGLINTHGAVGDNFNMSLAQLEGVILGRDQLIAIAQQLIYPSAAQDSAKGPSIQELASDPSAFTGATKLSGEGNGLGILSATLFVLETVAFAASLKTGSPPLYLSLVIATKDSDAPRGQGGFVGPELQKIISGFTQTIDTLFGVRDRPGGQAMLEPLLTALAAIILGGTAHVFENGIASVQTDSPQEKKDEQRFSAELTLKLITASKTFDEIASGVVVTGEIPSSSQQLAANGLTLGTLLLVAYTASLQGGQTQDSVLNLLQPELQPLFEQLNQSGAGMLSPALGMFLQQGLLALQEGNPAALGAAMEQGLQSAGISPVQLKADLQQMQNQASGIVTGALEGMDDKTDTGTSIQFVTA